MCLQGVPHYGAVVLLLRSPYHALLAERNRKESQHSNKIAAHSPEMAENAHQNNASTHTLSVGVENFGKFTDINFGKRWWSNTYNHSFFRCLVCDTSISVLV